MQVFIIVLVAAAILAALIFLHHKHVGFTRLVFLSLVVGIIFGVTLQLLYGTKSEILTDAIDWINIVGNGYISLLQMVIIPLIFVSLVGAFTKLKVAENLRRMAATTVGLLLGTTAIAALVGIASVLIFRLNGAKFLSGAAASSTALDSIKEHQADLKGLTLPQQIVSFLPNNIFADFAGSRASSTIAVVIFSLLIGVAFLRVKQQFPQEAATFARGIEALDRIVNRLVKMILALTPYGIFALITKAAATDSFADMAKLAVFIVAVYAGVLVMFLIHTIILLIARINPVTYYKKAWPALIFAFTSRSSAGTLPLNVRIQNESMGISSTVANFAASLGLTIGQNGCAGLYPAMVAAIIAPTVGINVFSPQFILSLIAVVTISSFGVAGVGGGATFTTLMVLGTLNLPVGILGVLIAIDPIVDMARTALNVNDSILTGLITAKSMGEVDMHKFADRAAVVSREL